MYAIVKKQLLMAKILNEDLLPFKKCVEVILFYLEVL